MHIRQHHPRIPSSPKLSLYLSHTYLYLFATGFNKLRSAVSAGNSSCTFNQASSPPCFVCRLWNTVWKAVHASLRHNDQLYDHEVRRWRCGGGLEAVQRR